jgi:hypothetical protein
MLWELQQGSLILEPMPQVPFGHFMIKGAMLNGLKMRNAIMQPALTLPLGLLRSKC